MRLPFATMRLIATYVGPQRRTVLLLGLCLLASIGLQIGNPLNMAAFLDGAMSGAPMERLLSLAGLFTGLALLQQGLAIVTAYLGEDVGWGATNRLRLALARHCLHLDSSFHSVRTPGELIERIDGDVAALSNFFSQFVIQVLGNALLMIGVLVLMFFQDWRLGLPMLVFVLITLLAIGRVRLVGAPYWKAQRQASAELYSFVEERIGGAEELRANGATAYTLQRLAQLLRNSGRRELYAGLVSSITVNVAWLLFACANALALLIAAFLHTEGRLTVGAAYLAFYYTNLLTRPLERLLEQFEDAQRAFASLGRAQAILAIRTRLPGGIGTRLPEGSLSVAFENVTFRYHDQNPHESEAAQPDDVPSAPILDDLSFALPAGTVLGLLGRTGSGKTTLARQLVRLYDPDQGVVRVGGVDVREPQLGEVRQRVALVTQQVQLFRASLRDNLTFFDAGIPDSTILDVLDELGLQPWFARLANGLDTLLAPGDAGVSAGEGQLLAFARVFLRNPGLVILDEASSRLDPATEQVLVRAIDRLVSGRSAIIIAHRLATVQRCDQIMIMEHGRIIEFGPRVALAADPASRFAGLLQTGLEEVLV